MKVNVKMFKAAKSTKRFRKNQKVWIKFEFGNHLSIRHKWRGSGRYVSSYIDKHNHNGNVNPIIGTYDYTLIPVEREFADRHGLQTFD